MARDLAVLMRQGVKRATASLGRRHAGLVEANHTEFFAGECARIGRVPDGSMLVV